MIDRERAGARGVVEDQLVVPTVSQLSFEAIVRELRQGREAKHAYFDGSNLIPTDSHIWTTSSEFSADCLDGLHAKVPVN